MRTLIWKELRENSKWALLALIALGAAQCYALFQTPYGQPDYYFNTGITLCKKQFLLVTTFGYAGIGLLLGLLQILPELKRDRWAALLHRPVTKGTVFWAKLLAGAVLYATATIPPFALSVWLAATPGYFSAPFVPMMVLPGLADLANGFLYYLAALALALLRGGWFGLRALPVLAALHVSYFVQQTPYFYVAIEAIAAMGAALLLAGWGIMRSQDLAGPRPWVSRAAFFTVVFFGVCGFGDVARSLLIALGPKPRQVFYRYELSREGTPMRIKYVNSVVTEVTDPDGGPINDPKLRPDRVRSQINYVNILSSYIGDSHGWKSQRYRQSYRESEKYVFTFTTYQNPKFEQWFQLMQPRSLVSYLPTQKTAVDRFDARGFQNLADQPVPLPETADFSQASQDRFFLSDSAGLQFINLARRTITDVSLPAPGPIYGAGVSWASTGDGDVSVFAAALASGIAVFDTHAVLITVLPYGHDTDRWGKISLGISPDLKRYFLWYQPSAWIDAKTERTMPSYVDAVDAKGQVLESRVLPPLPRVSNPPSWNSYLTPRLQSPAFFAGSFLYQKVGAEFGSERLGTALERRLTTDWKNTRLIATWIGGMSVAMAALTLVLSRRMGHAWPTALAWTGFVLMLNVGGILTFLLLAKRPARVDCPSCARLRPIADDNCMACGAAWPAIEQTGTEIFDNGAATARSANS